MSAHGHRGIALPDDGNRDARCTRGWRRGPDVDASGRSRISPPSLRSGGLLRRHWTNRRRPRYEATAAGVGDKRSSIGRALETLLVHAKGHPRTQQATISLIRRSSSGYAHARPTPAAPDDEVE